MSQLTNIQVRIKNNLENYKALQIAQSHLDVVVENLKTAYEERKKMEKSLDKELKDVERLQSTSIKSVFYNILGSKEDQLDIERQEYLEANLKFNESLKNVDLLEFEKDLLEKKTQQIPSLINELNELKKLRKTEILRGGNQNLKSELENSIYKLDSAILLKKELEEAINEGIKSQKLVEIIISYLRKARDWGRWDTNRNNRRGDYMRHRAIDNAFKYISKTQYQLDRFNQELADLGAKEFMFATKNLNFKRFRDFFFDNLISDWIIQQRIKSTISSMEMTTDQIKRIILSLNHDLKLAEKNYTELEKAINDILLN